jgi:hypothetical protein
MLLSKPVSDVRTTIWVLCSSALRQLSGEDTDRTGLPFFNLARMLEHMRQGGYNHARGLVGVDELNDTCLGLLARMKLDPTDMRQQMIRLIAPSIRPLTPEQLATVKAFLVALQVALDPDNIAHGLSVARRN